MRPLLGRRHCLLGIAATVAGAAVGQSAHGQAAWGIAWSRIPAISILATPGDARVPLVHDASFWNRALAEIGSAFRLGRVAETAGSLPIAELVALSQAAVGGGASPPLPDGARSAAGNIVVALSDGNFISFSFRWPALAKGVVGIKRDRSYPLTLPNVARNVIAHELGHAIGLGHNGDPRVLMCGRPAPCRPDLFASPTMRYFPLSEAEEAMLLRLYPAGRQPS